MDNTLYLLAASEVGQRGYETALESGPSIPGLRLTGQKPGEIFFDAASELANDKEAMNALVDYIIGAYREAEVIGDDFYETVLRFALQSNAISEIEHSKLQSGSDDLYKKVAPWVVLACMMISVEYKDKEFTVKIPNNEVIEKVIDAAELFFNIERKE